MSRTKLLNSLIKQVGAKSYLEIGIGRGVTFSRIDCPVKVGVDPARNPGIDEYYQMTSNEFFAKNKRKFDVIFIDGLHTKKQVLKDFNNSIKLAKVVVLHDCNPTSEKMQIVPQTQSEWTGDVWKAWIAIRKANKGVCINKDYGLGVVFVDKKTRPVYKASRLSYADLETNRKELLGLIDEI